MNPLKYQLKQLVSFLEEAKVEYAVLGGIAVCVYSEPRMTQDIDLNIILNMDDLTEFLSQAEKYGFRPALSNINKFVKETGVIPMKFFKNEVMGKFDFIVAQNPIEFAGIKRARFKRILDVKVKIVAAEDLLLHKLLSDRLRDREDARGIILRQGKKLDSEYIAAWLKKIEKVSSGRHLVNEFKKLLLQVNRGTRGPVMVTKTVSCERRCRSGLTSK